ncbi:hypothetical protein EDD90_6791 [Streptomyces sp. Ag109_O5-1]|uniref:hypothetical protein n=1 Tax=Streptomyces sp. Ag109_O5-1 TaxID=1938851 RepID=UPI000FA900F7|nr:hypothetical protein [Streptomyces sp. Ag109_O5-1]RPE43584.1 hypothetical protein EDD90_6791 [Streptomyces sp. Ag109_O5-1]
MTDPLIDVAAWRERLAALQSSEVSAAVIVQCDLMWLQPGLVGLRNEIDRAVMNALLRRGAGLTVDRVILHNLPVDSGAAARPASADRAFEEWHHRLSATSLLLCASDRPAPKIHRLILDGDQSSAPIPDMVEVLDNGDWTDHQRAGLALDIIHTVGATTPLTGYDMPLDGPFGDADPSVYM